MRRLALLLLGATLVALFLPLFLRDHVAYPSDNALEVGLVAPEAADADEDGSSPLTDASHFYVPTLHQQLRGNASGWISTWDPHSELGRPSFQLYGLGKAFLLTRVFAWFSDDALTVYTWSAVTAVVLTCLFGFLLLEALGLHPLACLTGALGLGIGGLAFSAFCFTLFLWGRCWETALFWSVTTFLRRPTLARGLAVAFFTHALLLTGYPQSIVWLAYPLAGYAVLRLARDRAELAPALARGGKLAACVAVGCLGAVPVYADLLANARLGTRLEFDPAFFAEILPHLDSLRSLGTFVASTLDAACFGNPWCEATPARSDPFLLPLWTCLAAAGFALGGLRRLWPIHAFVLAAVALTVWEELYLLAVRFLGLGLSRTLPLRLAFLALVVLAALTADQVLRGTLPARRRALAAIAAASALVVAGAWGSDLPVAGGHVLFAGSIVLGTAAFVVARRGWILVVLTLASTLVHGRELLISRAREEVRLDSPLVERVRRETAGGARYAWAGLKRARALVPNQEALYGLRSIHSFNSLSSRRYQDWAARFRRAVAFGTNRRRFLFVDLLPRFQQEAAALAGTSILLSRLDVAQERVVLLERTPAGIGIFRSEVAPILELQTDAWDRTGPEDARIEAGDAAPGLAVERTVALDDRLAFQVTPVERETLLFVSQQYHPGWRARADGRTLPTLAVNDVFQGVLLPSGTRAVELEFNAWARWSWIPQAFFALAAALVLALRFLRRAPAPEPA